MGKKRATTATKTRSTSRPAKLPELMYIVACDAATRDPSSGKASLFGIFEGFTVSDVPATLAPFAVFAKMRGGTGKHRISFDIIDPDGNRLKGSGSVIDATLKANAVSEMIVHVMRMEFPKTGIYQVVFRSGRRWIGKPLEIPVKRGKKK